MKKLLIKGLKITVCLYIIVCTLLYFFQEKLIFFPEKLAPDYRFAFSQPFEEINVNAPDGVSLHNILFKARQSKGVIFYLHGNMGSLRSWGKVAQLYLSMDYDVFMPDYRGYGKSKGSIDSEMQFYADMQADYNTLKKQYPENQIIVLGYSIGTGPAANLAAANNPKMLILQAPYYNLKDMMGKRFPIVPTFLLKYKFDTAAGIQNCRMPVTIFHGDADEIIYYGSSLKLQTHFKSSDTLITLHAQKHNGMTDNPEYVDAISKILGYNNGSPTN
ncbi:MAG: alpha/beta hydrolase [Flavobacterium sp. BFFFF1]|uniref:alpha/beta hydrolase n=1 Tax=Flavobacterium sp. BFFFF1 TaxID=2015557 RepID=UPI000BCA0FE7|nr:alpha/beta fold hydrolase [Flavobacterium sp. BFFFF1]OYU79229.1 MAG: alpha/beta hydrolase [Flavobacterium sp. BFFFF1]